ncbi:hypothetical protein ANAPRD1_00347 [Anaplasma phagocytophilum]|uniref:hypothetical protein n=1 Tax=Anaplasma phagocytophilum TaxID=948 RepID=UPI0007E178B1|nr:hypothetical protein [Anaplasma phagocytophilum]SCV63131.1 hypothetical protein ANAPRD1_00347 [Anaplasma phagocytophilum]SCV64872.1 hypothetical protein ANAPH2_01095 [Anaplasma phagocytophilum]SCV66103.1 hypothetical protein ANAPH1_00964 [Anaplasma phagocytophilum]
MYSYRSTRRVRHGHKSSEEVFSIVKKRTRKAHYAVKVALEEAEALRNPPSDADVASADAAGPDVAGAGADAAGLDVASADVADAITDISEQIDFQLLNEIASKLSDLSRQAYHLEHSSLPYDILYGLSKLSSNPKLLLSPNNSLAGHLNDAFSYVSNVIEILQLHFGRYKVDDPSRIFGKELADHETVLRFRRAARTLCNAFDSISDDALQNALKPVMECNIQKLRTIVAQSSAVSLSMSYLVCRETSQENKMRLQDCIRQKFEPLVMVAKAVLEAPNCSSETTMSCSIACAAYDIMCTELNGFANDKPTLDSAVEDTAHIYANLLECISCVHLMHSWYRKTANIEGDPTNSDIIRNAMMAVALSLQECVADLNHNRKSDGSLCNTFTSACLSGITKHITSAQQCLQSLNTDSMINPDESRILVAACRNAFQAIESRCERRIRERSIENVGQPERTGDVATLLTNILTNRSMTFSKAASSTLFPNLQ